MQWLRTTAKLRGKLARWSLILNEYDFKVIHRAGKDNTAPDCLSRQPTGVAAALSYSPGLSEEMKQFMQLQIAMAFTAGAMEGMADVWPTSDIWDSPLAVSFVKGELQPGEVTPQQLALLTKKCKRYSFSNGKLWRGMNTKMGYVQREVPPTAARPQIIQQLHESIGHLGRDRTFQVVARHYVWPGMHKDVSIAVKQCRACDRVKASFNMKHDRLKPLPLFGLFYRFSIDSAGPLPVSNNGYQYVIVIVEHFSKWIELVPVKQLDSKTTAQAFNDRVLARYGAPVEVVSDNGQEYQGAFRALLQQHGIDQVDIPPGHPQANGMAERIVNVMKTALRKVVPTLGVASWELHMPVIEFGYRVSKQASTGFSPYFLLFGRDHLVPEQVRSMVEEPLDLDDYSVVMDLITVRSDQLQSAMPKAFEHALQAQRRDVVKYRKVRRGDVLPRRHRFEVGSYVYLSQPPLNTLDVRTTRTILRVKEVHGSGWLTLVGSDGQELQVHMDNCAPCHLSNLVPARFKGASVRCRKCGSDSTAMPRVRCDKCQSVWHVDCAGVELPLAGDEWICPSCRPTPA